jgi:hypothetical protein
MRRGSIWAAAAFAAGLLGLTAIGASAKTSPETGVESGIEAGGRVVRGSCAESYLPIFAAARDVRFNGAYARIAVRVMVSRDPETGAVLDAAPILNGQTDLPDAAVAAVLAGVKAAYLQPEADDCRGVITGRTDWVLRFGERTALVAPDDPLIINRATAATRLRHRSGSVELMDPTTARTRITRVPNQSESDPQRCYTSELWRDFGPLPPVSMLARGEAYRIRFYVEANGQARDVEVIPLEGTREASAELREAVAQFVTLARYYPPITEDCRTRNALATMVIGRQ